MKIFISVGGTATESQEAFIKAVEERLRSEGLDPQTVGRNRFSSDAPLKTILDLMNECAGTVVIALERSYFPNGIDKRGGPNESPLGEVRLPTPWNQIEAAIACAKGHPLLIIVERGVKSEGLLERGHSWYVQWIKPTAEALSTSEFNGVLADWKTKVIDRSKIAPDFRPAAVKPGDITIGELLRGLTAAQLWSVLAGLAALIAGAFWVGATLFPEK